jgi:hypothetical protein
MLILFDVMKFPRFLLIISQFLREKEKYVSQKAKKKLLIIKKVNCKRTSE